MLHEVHYSIGSKPREHSCFPQACALVCVCVCVCAWVCVCVENHEAYFIWQQNVWNAIEHWWLTDPVLKSQRDTPWDDHLHWDKACACTKTLSIITDRPWWKMLNIIKSNMPSDALCNSMSNVICWMRMFTTKHHMWGPHVFSQHSVKYADTSRNVSVWISMQSSSSLQSWTQSSTAMEQYGRQSPYTQCIQGHQI